MWYKCGECCNSDRISEATPEPIATIDVINILEPLENSPRAVVVEKDNGSAKEPAAEIVGNKLADVISADAPAATPAAEPAPEAAATEPAAAETEPPAKANLEAELCTSSMKTEAHTKPTDEEALEPVAEEESQKGARSTTFEANQTAKSAKSPEEIAGQRRAAVIAALSNFSSTAAFMLIILTSVNFSMNEIINDDKEEASPYSQILFTCTIIAREASSAWTSEFTGKAGKWYGRRKVLMITSFGYFICAAMSYCTHKIKFAPGHILAHIFVGCCGPVFPTVSGYIADVSIQEKTLQNTAIHNMLLMLGVAFGAAINAALVKHFTLGYFAAMFFSVLAVAFAWKLPDWSPPLNARDQPDRSQIKTAVLCGPCGAVSSWKRQTAFTKCIMIAMGFASGAIASAGAWIVNYMLEEYEFEDQIVGVFVLFYFVSNALVLGIISPLLKPWSAILLGALSLPIGVFLLWVGPGGPSNKLFYFLAIVPNFPGSVTIPATLTLYWAQRPSSERHELVSLLKVTGGISKACGALMGGAAAAAWLNAKDNGSNATNYIRPQWVTTCFALGSATFYGCAYRYRAQDTLKWQELKKDSE